MIATIAWRNVWRNGRRSGILIAAIAFGIWAGLLEMAFMNGMANQQLEAAIRSRTSHIQIHADGFRAHKDVTRFIPAGDSVLAAVRAACRRRRGGRTRGGGRHGVFGDHGAGCGRLRHRPGRRTAP